MSQSSHPHARHHARGDDGFSFIELLAYMAIAALLILAAIPQFSAYRTKAVVSNMQSDLKHTAEAMEAEYVTSLRYAPLASLRVPTSHGVTITSGDGDGNSAALGFLRPNTGQAAPAFVALNKSGGTAGSIAAEYPAATWYMGVEGSGPFQSAYKACGGVGERPYSITEPHYVSCKAGVATSGRIVGSGFLAPASDPYNSATQIEWAGPTGEYYNWLDSWDKYLTADPTGESFCFTATATQAPGVTWSYNSRMGLVKGGC